MKEIKILWTGGWDSTFRVVELSRMNNVIIQPIYVLDPERKSTEYEMTSINKIIDMLNDKHETRAELRKPIIYLLKDIPADKEISESYKKIHETTQLGAQHEWLAWLGKIHPGMEMGTEAGNAQTSHIISALDKYCKMNIQDGIGYIDCNESTNDGNLVLGWFTFPLITRTEKDMFEQILEWGYEDVMSNIWFCHNPIKGKPCGFCHPCDVKMDSNMEWLLPDDSQKRYINKKKISKVFGNKMGNLYVRVVRKINS